MVDDLSDAYAELRKLQRRVERLESGSSQESMSLDRGRTRIGDGEFLVDGDGLFRLVGTFDQTGTYNVNSGGAFNLNNGGDLNVNNGGDVTVNDGGDVVVTSGGGISVNGGGDLDINSGGNARVNDGGDLDINSGGNARVNDGGGLGIWDGGVVRVHTGGELDVLGNAYVANGGDLTVNAGGELIVNGPEKITLKQFNILGSDVAAMQLGNGPSYIFGNDGIVIIQGETAIRLNSSNISLGNIPTGSPSFYLGVDDNGKIVKTSNTGGGGNLPDTWTMTSTTGQTFTLEKKNLEYAQKIVQVAADSTTEDLIDRLAAMCIMCVMVEAPPILIYANSTIPESLNYPHDAVGSDGGSVGIYQQQPQFGWGTVEECMQIDYSTRAFIGGSGGPNGGNPPGIKDMSGWDTSSNWGAVVQSVQVSAYPDRYESWKPAALELVAMIRNAGGGGDDLGRFMWPFDLGSVSSEYGWRDTGFHEGIDFALPDAPAGAPIVAAGTGDVQEAVANHPGWGNYVRIAHAISPTKVVSTLYAHMVNPPTVSGVVMKGEVIGHVGNTGNSFGAHLHFETWDGTASGTHMDPRDFMALYGPE